MTIALRASCVRCNAVLAPETFEQDWSFARCAKCGARSPVPETVRRARPEAFISRVPRALEDVVARRPEGIEAGAEATGTTLALQIRRGPTLSAVMETARTISRMAREGRFGDPLPSFDTWTIELSATTEGERLRVEGSASGRMTLADPFAHSVRAVETGFELVIRGGYPVSEEWVAGVIPDHARAGWVAEWIAAQLRAHLAATRTSPSARGSRAYRG